MSQDPWRHLDILPIIFGMGLEEIYCVVCRLLMMQWCMKRNFFIVDIAYYWITEYCWILLNILCCLRGAYDAVMHEWEYCLGASFHNRVPPKCINCHLLIGSPQVDPANCVQNGLSNISGNFFESFLKHQQVRDGVHSSRWDHSGEERRNNWQKQ